MCASSLGSPFHKFRAYSAPFRRGDDRRKRLPETHTQQDKGGEPDVVPIGG